jgi:ribosomal protein S18 acetylase RimI-like enzyme
MVLPEAEESNPPVFRDTIYRLHQKREQGMIREANHTDIPAMVDIHAAALPEDLLPRLGKRFLRNFFYPAVLKSGHALSLVETDNDMVRSFVIFSHTGDALLADITRSKVKLSFYFFSALLRDFSVLGDVIVLWRGVKSVFHGEQNLNIKEIPELFLIATAPECRSKGIGGRLMRKGLDMLLKQNQACLVKTSSPKARRFYVSHDFDDIGFEYRRGKKMHLLLYRHDIG